MLYIDSFQIGFSLIFARYCDFRVPMCTIQGFLSLLTNGNVGGMHRKEWSTIGTYNGMRLCRA